MISAMLDNYIYQHQDEGFGMREVWWRRVLDVNDRNLRNIITGLGARTDGLLSESGFDITPASEIMAILCLASSEEDLHKRLDNIILGITLEGKPLYLRELNITGSIVALFTRSNLIRTLFKP